MFGKPNVNLSGVDNDNEDDNQDDDRQNSVLKAISKKYFTAQTDYDLSFTTTV